MKEVCFIPIFIISDISSIKMEKCVKYNRNQKEFLRLAIELYGQEALLDRDQISVVMSKTNIPYPAWFCKPEFREGRGMYRLPKIDFELSPLQQKTVVENQVNESVVAVASVSPMVKNVDHVDRKMETSTKAEIEVPEKIDGYVEFGFYKELKNIIKSKDFYPVFISGHTGNGKTTMVEQICASLKRPLIRVNISVETDETDLIGGPILVDGNIVVRDGPVITAMRQGAVLLIDEIDRGSNKLMCMQAIMEGKSYYNKKSGEVIKPAPGFNIIATANTKGRGSDDGKYLAQILDDAFLERFPITVEQEYPPASVEKKILSFLMNDEEFIERLVQWAEVVRKSFQEGAVDELISTRRLVHIAKAYNIFNDRLKAITLCVNRFDSETKESFIDLYTKIDEKCSLNKEYVEISVPTTIADPFIQEVNQFVTNIQNP